LGALRDRQRRRDDLLYVALYVAADWISFIHALPGSGYTPWNPPPALSLALLVSKGPLFAPAVFAAELISSHIVGHFPGVPASLASAAVDRMTKLVRRNGDAE
jgi:two-component system, LuxR family, sensor kinase FixL